MLRAERRYMDLGAIFDAHVQAEFVDKDVAATMATMAPEPYLTHVPTLTGGTGRVEVERFYRDHFVGHWPERRAGEARVAHKRAEPCRRRTNRQLHA